MKFIIIIYTTNKLTIVEIEDIRGARLRKFNLRKIILGVRMHFRHTPRSRTELTGMTLSVPMRSGTAGIWSWRRLDAHHSTSVFLVFSCRRLLLIHVDISPTQVETASCSGATPSVWQEPYTCMRVIRIEMNMETMRSRQSSEVCGVKQKQDRSEDRALWYTANECWWLGSRAASLNKLSLAAEIARQPAEHWTANAIRSLQTLQTWSTVSNAVGLA